MRNLILLLAVLSAAPVAAQTKPLPLHELMEHGAVSTQAYGEKHPRVVLINKEIDRRLHNGERLDAEAIELRLIELVRERAELRRAFGARHPTTIDNAKRIQAIAGMLVSAE